MADCIFCRIVAREVPARVLAEDEDVIAIADIAPQAPVHALVIPHRHIAGLGEVDDPGLLARLVATATGVAAREGVADGGYRVVVNVGRDGGQTVSHLHVHVLGGRPMVWPPG